MARHAGCFCCRNAPLRPGTEFLSAPQVRRSPHCPRHWQLGLQGDCTPCSAGPRCPSGGRRAPEYRLSSRNSANDLDREQLVAALQAFGRQAQDADWAVIYFAGHGVEIDGVDYLVPTDARLKHRSHVEAEAITFDRAIDATSGARKARVAILDASRDDALLGPRPRSMLRRGSWVGMIPLEPSAVPTVVVYATKSRHSVVVGEGTNGAFASALTSHLLTPGLELSSACGQNPRRGQQEYQP